MNNALAICPLCCSPDGKWLVEQASSLRDEDTVQCARCQVQITIAQLRKSAELAKGAG